MYVVGWCCVGWLDVADVVQIPDDLSVRLSVGQGLTGASDDEWLDYRGMYERAARPVKLPQFTGYRGLSCLLIGFNYLRKWLACIT